MTCLTANQSSLPPATSATNARTRRAAVSQIDTTFPRIPCAFFNPFGLLALFISLPSRFIGVFRAGEGAGVESAQGKSSASSKTTPPNFTAPEASIRADPISLTIPL